MSQLIIHYGSLEDAQKKAEKAGDKLADYAEKAQSKVASKISSYSGQRTGNISSAQDYINNKIKQLQNKSGAFLQYANDVGVFIEEAKETDKAVKERINTLSGNFKSDYGIKDNIITNVFNYLSDKLNETALGRFFKDMAQVVAKTIVSLKDCIVEWYKYEGGKYIIDAALAVGAFVLAVCAVVAAVVMGGPLIVVLAGIFVGVVAGLNAMTDFRNSIIAYGKEKQGDPAWAKRFGDLNTWTDTIRARSNNINDHIFANVWDGLEFAANVILIIHSGAKIFNNFKSIAQNYGGFKEYFRYQYKANSQGLSVVKNAIFGSAGEKTRARELLKLYGNGKIADLKNAAALYLNPRNWFAKSTQRANMQGYSAALESMGIEKLSTVYNGVEVKNITIFGKNGPTWFQNIFHTNNRAKVQGLSGILGGTDRSFSNIAATVNSMEKLWKSVSGLNSDSLWKSLGTSQFALDKNDDWKSFKVTLSDITVITDKAGKQAKKFIELLNGSLKNIQNMSALRQNLQGI